MYLPLTGEILVSSGDAQQLSLAENRKKKHTFHIHGKIIKKRGITYK